MSDRHLSRQLLFAALRGEVPPRMVSETVFGHLSGLCLPCQVEAQGFYQEATDVRRMRGLPIPLLPSLRAGQVPWLTEVDWRAKRDLRALLAVPPEQRQRKVERSQKSFRGAELAKLLLGESERRVHASPEEARHLADLARVVLLHSRQQPGDFDLLALSWAHMANACRARGNLREAEGHFEHLRSLVASHGMIDLALIARIDELEGSLRRDQRRFEAARNLLSRAERLYRLTGDRAGGARTLLILAATCNSEGRPEWAIRTAREALGQLPPGASRRLLLAARYNLAFYLSESGRYAEAIDMLARDEALYQEFPEPWTQLRLTWLRGKIAAGQGDLAAAEEAFLVVQQGFASAGIGYDAAMLAVGDLAPLYLLQGRTADVKRLAEEMLPIFQAQDVHREALAALMLFQEAARREELTVQQLRDLVRYLEDARKDPSLRFGGS
jgi:tetratricopeptide (TPR) repeat protein